MKTKKILACLAAVLMMGTVFTACTGKSESTANSAADSKADSAANSAEDSADDSVAPTKEAVAVTEAPPVEVEPANSAESGQAFLAITDKQVWISYWGNAEGDGYMLAYDAGIADITGDGQYTVSVNADTVGFRLDALGDANGEYKCSGLGFAAVIIRDGETVCPDAIITIDSILVDGKEIEMTAKNYTSTEDGNIRSNIYNGYISAPASDARCQDGMLYEDYDTSKPALADADQYSPHIVDPADFASWTKIEVNFTVSGLDGAAADDGADDGDAAADGAADAADPAAE